MKAVDISGFESASSNEVGEIIEIPEPPITEENPDTTTPEETPENPAPEETPDSGENPDDTTDTIE